MVMLEFIDNEDRFYREENMGNKYKTEELAIEAAKVRASNAGYEFVVSKPSNEDMYYVLPLRQGELSLGWTYIIVSATGRVFREEKE